MDIRKQGRAAPVGAPDEAQLAKINAIAKGTLTKDDVYVFSVRLCDDQVDRDFERFSAEAIEALAPMFVGRPGIVDHDWSAERQVARVFDTAVEREAGQTYLRAWAYMLRTEKTKSLIADIEGGIRQEVSIGCAMGKSTCSVCGSEYGACEHKKGAVYGGETCCAVLSEPTDAYEFSFVAVPAQKKAGVLKKKLLSDDEQDALARVLGQTILDQSESDHAVSCRYRERVRKEFRRAALLAGMELDDDELDSLGKHLSVASLEKLTAQLTKSAEARYPLRTQLQSAAEKQEKLSSEFLI